jgi:hypothetical protein
MRVSATDIDEGDNQKITYDLMAKSFEADIEYFRYVHLMIVVCVAFIFNTVNIGGRGSGFRKQLIPGASRTQRGEVRLLPSGEGGGEVMKNKIKLSKKREERVPGTSRERYNWPCGLTA